MQIFIIIKKDILKSVNKENQSNLIDHFYCIVFNIQKIYL